MNKDNSEEKTPGECCKNKNIFKHHQHHGHGTGNPIYGLGVIGALFYFLKGATTFTAVMMGIGKSIFWPAILMFKLLTYLKRNLFYVRLQSRI
ncbi:MAG: hypothetical protein NTZ55_03735 [Candidatus Roizmanbacteria bacterium]|nr:hypothetical protein [Candidatus Roizmanbacteria bacterium]